MTQGHRFYQQDDALTIEMPATMFGTQTVVFTKDYIADDKKKIFYRDATEIYYTARQLTANFICTMNTYEFKISSVNQQIEIVVSTAFNIGNAERKDMWQKLVGIASHVIQPHIVENLTRRIFVNGESVDIYGLKLTRDGYSTGKFLFWGGDQVRWADACAPLTTWHAGKVIILGRRHSKDALWQIPVDTPNAVVLPDLMKACLNAASTGYVPVNL